MKVNPSFKDPQNKLPIQAENKGNQNPGNELGQDSASISKEFAKGTSSGSVGALTNAKETAKADKDQRRTEEARSADDIKRVTPTKTVSASQADTGIKSQTNSQSKSEIQNEKTKSPNIEHPQVLKTCPACKGIGCSACKPELGTLFTQDQVQYIASIENNKQNNKQMNIKKNHRITPIQNVQLDKTNRKKSNISVYKDSASDK